MHYAMMIEVTNHRLRDTAQHHILFLSSRSRNKKDWGCRHTFSGIQIRQTGVIFSTRRALLFLGHKKGNLRYFKPSLHANFPNFLLECRASLFLFLQRGDGSSGEEESIYFPNSMYCVHASVSLNRSHFPSFHFPRNFLPYKSYERMPLLDDDINGLLIFST